MYSRTSEQKTKPQIYPIATKGYPGIVVVEVELSYPMMLMARGFDRDHINTTYFSHPIGEVGEMMHGHKKIQFRLPKSPGVLMLNFYDGKTKRQDGIRVKSITDAPLEKKMTVTDSYLEAFKEFAMEIAQKAGYMAAGDGIGPAEKQMYYESNDEQFIFKYSKNIYERDKETGKYTGNISVTPARVIRSTGGIEGSQAKLIGIPVPRRYLVLLHEFYHHYKNTGNEIEADMGALLQYLGEGWSKTEAYYTFELLFKDSTSQAVKERMKHITDYLTQFKY